MGAIFLFNGPTTPIIVFAATIIVIPLSPLYSLQPKPPIFLITLKTSSPPSLSPISVFATTQSTPATASSFVSDSRYRSMNCPCFSCLWWVGRAANYG